MSLSLLFCLLAVAGCQQHAPPENEAGAVKASPAKSPGGGAVGKSVSSTEGPGRKQGGRQKAKTAAPLPPPLTPDAAVTRVVNGIREKRPEVLWDFLPGSFQQDINSLVHLFGRKMDAELWTRTVHVARRITALCRERKPALLNSPLFRSSDAAVQRLLSAEWDAAVSLAETLLRSDLADVNRLRQFDGRRFLASTGGELMQQLARFSRLLPGDTFHLELQELARLKAHVVSREGEFAVVELTLDGLDAEPQRVEFLRKEGKWIPRRMADTWEDTLTRMRKKIEAELAPDVLLSKKKRLLALLEKLEHSLSRLEQTKDDAEFSRRFAASPVAPLVLSFFRSSAGEGEGTPVVLPPGKEDKPQPGKKGKATTLTVIVQGRLKEAEAEKVADELFALGKYVDVGPSEVRGNNTCFPVVTRQSFRAFRNALRFADIVSVDERKKEIVLRLRSADR